MRVDFFHEPGGLDMTAKNKPLAADLETSPAAAHPMDDLAVRQLRFKLDVESVRDQVWSQSQPDFALFINALGVHVPYFERFLVKVMRAYRGELKDTDLLADVQDIIGQESHHAFNFLGWNQALEHHYPGIKDLAAHAKADFDAKFEHRSKKFQIGFTAGYETFTFLGGMIILNRYQELMADADPTLRALWVWHQVEEVEHGAVAFDFYRAFYPKDQWYRRWMVLHAFSHISWETYKAYALMIRRQGYYTKPGRAWRAWKFFAGFAFDLARAALPVLSRDYHPRQHPICNDAQNPLAVAWRKYHAAGHNTIELDNQTIQHLLAGPA